MSWTNDSQAVTSQFMDSIQLPQHFSRSRIERLCKILDQIIRMLDTCRQTEQTIIYTDRIPDFLRDIRMRLYRRVRHQRFHAAEALRERDQLDMPKNRLD